MTQAIAKVVASMLSSEDLFLVEDGSVWLPDLDSYSFSMQEHITRALELHGYSASSSTRSHSGLWIDIPEADSVTADQVKSIHSSAYGYTGRVAGIETKGQMFPADIDEPGNILRIPSIGWTGGRERVVIGKYDGLFLAKVNSDNLETFTNEDTFRVESVRFENEREMSLREMEQDGRIIVYKGEWNGYPQERY